MSNRTIDPRYTCHMPDCDGHPSKHMVCGSEPLTSNPKVWTGWNAANVEDNPAHAASELLRYADEIERLTRELEVERMCHKSASYANPTSIGPSRDRLAAELAASRKAGGESYAAVRRLRAALERVVAAYIDGAKAMVIIAKEALAGAADETTPALVEDTPLSRFVRSSPEEKEALYLRAITKASEQQNEVIRQRLNDGAKPIEVDPDEL